MVDHMYWNLCLPGVHARGVALLYYFFISPSYLFPTYHTSPSIPLQQPPKSTPPSNLSPKTHSPPHSLPHSLTPSTISHPITPKTPTHTSPSPSTAPTFPHSRRNLSPTSVSPPGALISSFVTSGLWISKRERKPSDVRSMTR